MAGALISVTSENWGTPKWLFDLAEALFGCKFDLDICAADNWTMVPENYITKEQDALNPNTIWNFNNAFCNPPYGAFIPLIMQRAINELQKDEEYNENPTDFTKLIHRKIVFLLPTKVEVKWFHNLVKKYASECWLLESRVKFNIPDDVEDKGQNATGLIGSMFVVFDSQMIHACDYDHNYECEIKFLSKEMIKELIKDG